jgi:hypothetical protein
MEIFLSKYALEQSRERGVSVSEIKTAIEKGAKFPQNGKVVSNYGHIRVVFKKIKNKFFVITVMIRL